MTDLFQPDSQAYPDDLDTIKLLSQRDLALRVPINFVPVAGASISAVCPVGDTYETASLAKCFSNLLVSEFRRFILDIYWDESRSVWSACPVQLGNAGRVSNTSTTTTTGSTSSLQLVSASFNLRELETPAVVQARQASAMSITTNTSSATTTIAAISPTATPLIHIGPYACSSTANLDIFLGTLAAYLDDTENNLNATTTYLSLNLHAALSPDLVVRPPSNLPRGSSSLQALFAVNTSSYLYTPANLRSQRADLNATGNWFGVPDNVVPDAAYFRISSDGSTSTTQDGWPSDSFVEFTKAKRLLVGFGSVSQEMTQYDTAADAGTIFTPGYLEQSHTYQLTSSGNVSSGCFYNLQSTQVSALNNSWAVADIQNMNNQGATQASTSLTTCGYTPVLNQTLDNVSAILAPQAYQKFAVSSIWSWDINEPMDHPNSTQNYHCAVLNATSGRWQVAGCGASRYCACRVNNGPYDWQISTSGLPYDRVDQACPENSIFTVARTALENEYLLHAWRTARMSNSISDELLFVNFNDLDVSSCWVIGQNTTCPYRETNDNSMQTITVPTVAAVIVFVLTILTIFVKCAANRQNTKRRRRRGHDEYGDYEGVPA
ncbi:hypothetical protein AMS68_006698 [Peltaster fructicola]|uniref:Maintenance of telomere capping protein 6 n=1 Tax=Peltaster fructicola TaxID=286661 RepID=A0A6H0Y2N0_9PEZI|nr:hypothetical protein AMS68_006698 [Peltaster fructicola]